MNVRFLIGAAALAALSIPSLCAAQGAAREPGFSFGLNLIYLDSKTLDFNGGSKLNIHDDFGAALTFGYDLNPKIELEFTLDWNNVDYDGQIRSADIAGLSANVRGEMETWVPRFTARYNFMPGPFTPFVGAGLGWAFVDTNIPTGRVETGCWWDPWWGQICTAVQPTKSADSFTYSGELGLRYDPNPNWSARFFYRKQWYDWSHATGSQDLDTIQLGFVYKYAYGF